MGYYVYRHTSPSGKIYIGITQQRPTKRWGGGSNYAYNDHFISAIRKYGWKNFTHEILFQNLTRDEARAKEIELIALYCSDDRNKGYNVSPGGEMQTAETKEKIRLKREELHLNELQSQRSLERWANPEFRERTLKNMRGKVRTPEARERYRQAAIRRGLPKPESTEKMKETLRQKTGEKSIRKRPVLQIAPVTLEIVGRYWTAREAAATVGASINGIATVCRKSGSETRASHGYFWCYEDEYDPDYFEQFRGVEFTATGELPRTAPFNRTSFKECHHTAESKAKMSAVHSRPVVCVETGEAFPSIRVAAQRFGVDSSAIGNCLRGKAKTSCGYHWRYDE